MIKIIIIKNIINKKFFIQKNCAYHKNVVDHYENPRNIGTLNKNDVNVGTSIVGSPACGDVIKLQILVDKYGKINKAVFKTFGCGSAIASASYTTEIITGMHINNAVLISNSDISKHLCLPPVKIHCSMLSEDAVKSAIENYKKKQTYYTYRKEK